MPNGVQGKNNWGRNVKGAGTDDHELTAQDKANYYHEWSEVMEALRFFPSIVMWVPFNEAWTQFDTEAVAAWTKAKDPSRIINSASGGNMRECGDILDMHVYPRPNMPLYESDLVVILGEYGGIGCPIEGHLWWNKRNWGYIQFNDTERVTTEYTDYANDIKKFIPQGMSAAIRQTQVRCGFFGNCTVIHKYFVFQYRSVHFLIARSFLTKKLYHFRKVMSNGI